MLYILVYLAGLFSGFINVIAGGGSLITLPVLNLLGLPIDIANGTNRIGIIFQNITATTKFRKSDVLDLKRAIFLSIPATLGALVGANIVVNIDRALLKSIVGFILIIMSIFLVWKPDIWTKERKVKKNNILSFIVFFLIGIYGGFIQAGVGFFLMSALVLLEGYDLVKTNAIKVFLVLIYTLFAFIVFALNNQVNYLAGFVLALGSISGGYLGSSFSIKKGSKWIQRILFVILIIIGIYYIFNALNK
ncbi:integrase [Marinitoga sp. 1154]|uniref:sulfite exporter TauE/SafE family protein n=1 Tax=Marinitoga sp. 1154 TaxID=1643335 RepID=UPI001585E053|nr:sulfite exporter TauE/SafE family protein [Marinitoga sp. 1154]NUU98575.1 integrase [Marinitoga sp. 1154]